MNFAATVAVIVALVTGPLPQADVTTRDLAAPGESPAPTVGQQNEREVQSVPQPHAPASNEPIAAFWIILPD